VLRSSPVLLHSALLALYCAAPSSCLLPAQVGTLPKGPLALCSSLDPPLIPSVCLRRFAPWSKGPVALCGDAAHPMMPNLGQGGCQSTEDGYRLAEELAKVGHTGDVTY
jgi:2-polyprenyl-6-methoxyphenol hydroxylase-like FAD-dependent oxidoreductase